MNLIQESTSEWASSILIVLKEDPNEPTKIKRRFVTDFRELNAHTVKDPYPMPLIADIMLSFASAKYFTALDLNSGFWQISLRSTDRLKNAFVTLDGLYEYVVMAMGLTNSPATFSRLMDKILGDLKWKDRNPIDSDNKTMQEFVELDKLFAFPVLELNKTVISLKDEQAKDPRIKEIKDKLEKGNNDPKLTKYIVDPNDVVYRQGSGRNRGSLLLFVPKHLINQ
ncbi:hypothetical protein B4U79_06149, partial [Dinothrombium tinctorium]